MTSEHVPAGRGYIVDMPGVFNVRPTFRPELWGNELLDELGTRSAVFSVVLGTRPPLTRRQRVVLAVRRRYRRLAWSVDAFVAEWRSW